MLLADKRPGPGLHPFHEVLALGPAQPEPQEQAALVSLHRRDANFADHLVGLEDRAPEARVEIIQRHDTLTPAPDQHEFRA